MVTLAYLLIPRINLISIIYLQRLRCLHILTIIEETLNWPAEAAIQRCF